MELKENQKYVEVLKQNLDKEKEKTRIIEDEFRAKKDTDRVNKIVKELEKIWNETKISIEKLFLIAEVCTYNLANFCLQFQRLLILPVSADINLLVCLHSLYIV